MTGIANAHIEHSRLKRRLVGMSRAVVIPLGFPYFMDFEGLVNLLYHQSTLRKFTKIRNAICKKINACSLSVWYQKGQGQ